VFERHAAQALLELGGTLSILTSTAKASNQGLAAQLPAEGTSLLVNVAPVLDHIQPWRIAERARWLDDAAWIGAIGAAAGAVAVARRRRAALLGLGIGAVAVGAAVLTVTAVVPRLAADEVGEAALSHAVWDGVKRFMGDLRTVGLWLIPVGVILGAAAT